MTCGATTPAGAALALIADEVLMALLAVSDELCATVWLAFVFARVPPPTVIWTAPWPSSTPIGGAGRMPVPTSASVSPVPGMTAPFDADAVC